MSASRLATTRPGYQASVPALADRAAGLTTFLDTHFSPTSLAALRAELTASVTSETMLNGARNNTITKLIPLIEAELDAGCTLLWQISRHLALLVPVIEDGNNFGVDVLQSTLKTVQDRESVISQYLGDLTTYFWQRGSILEKVGGKQWRGEGGVVEETKRTVTKGESEEEKTGDTATTGPPEEKDDPGGPASKKRKWGKEGECHHACVTKAVHIVHVPYTLYMCHTLCTCAVHFVHVSYTVYTRDL